MVGEVAVSEGATGEVEEMAALSIVLDSAVRTSEWGQGGFAMRGTGRVEARHCLLSASFAGLEDR